MSGAFHESAKRIIKGDLPTVRKSIMIGLGGSGMKGIAAARQYIERYMPREARRYMRWIGVDTTDIGTSIEGQGSDYRFPGEDQFYQDDRRTLYISAPTPSELSSDYMRTIREQEAYRWFPDPDVYTISTRAGQGANQTRALGRLAFFHNYERIREALIAERECLLALSNDPRYFQLLDIQEKSDVGEEDLIIRPVRGVTRYYLTENIPAHHDIVALELDETARSLLCPHVPPEKVSPAIFPRDEKGLYFEMKAESAGDQPLRFRIRHAAREAAISIFLTGSVVGGTGNGMFLDAAALIHDIFADSWPKPKVYGIVVLPSAFKRVVYNRNARANAYAALKEIDYFMSGNEFHATYPNGHQTVISERLFDDGMLYLLDVENQAGNVLQDRDQVQELTGQFIYTFVASSVGGAIEERMVNDSSRTSVYFPESGEEPRRRCSYNSFGISRVTYPAPMLRDLGFKLVSLRIIQNFRRRFDPKLLAETFGDLNRGLVRALRLNCRLIFERMNPDYRMDWRSEFNSYKQRIEKAIKKKDTRELVSGLELMHRDYGKGEMDRLKERLARRMEVRWRIELDKVQQVLEKAVGIILKDPGRGFVFCRAILDQIMGRLELYEQTYYKSRVGLQYYNDQEIEKLIGEIDTGEWKPKKAEAVYQMVRINYFQLTFETMLQASEEFVREFKALLFRIKNDTLVTLEDKLVTLGKDLQGEIQRIHFDLLQKINPLYFYLISKKEIQNFINTYFAKRLSIDDLSNDVDFLSMDRGDDTRQLIETYLISRYGLEILEKSSEELEEFIVQELGNEILSASLEEVRERLFGDGEEGELVISDATMNKIEVENLRLGLYKTIRKRFEGFNFENISIKKILDARHVPVKKILTRLDGFSRPYTTANLGDLKSMEYFRTITQFPLNTFEEGDVAPAENPNDLPGRMDHYTRREAASPDISVETFVVPNLCKPYEMISIGIVLGFPLFRIDGLRDSARDYHFIVEDRSHPMHLFNAPSFDARYFPDPFRDRNYLNPKHLWNGLVEYQVLEKQEDGFHYDESLHADLKSIQAREAYFGRIESVIKQVNANGGPASCGTELYSKAIVALGLLRKNKRSGHLQFPRDYDLVIRDIIDGDGTGQRAHESGLSKDEYIKQHIPSPQFSSPGELGAFLEAHPGVRGFLNRDMERLFEASLGSVSAGAAIQIPASAVRNASLPVYRDEFAFYDYFEREGSLEWQNLLKNRLVKAVEEAVRTFRHPQDPTLLDRGRIRAYLDERIDRIPFIVRWEVMVNTGVIR